MIQVAILGLSNFGKTLALKLMKNNAEVLAVDRNKNLINEIKDEVTSAVCLDCTDKDSLFNILDKNIDIAIISLGDRIENSILATLYIKEFGIKEIIVKANTLDQGKILKLVGATKIIFPEQEMAERLANSITHPNLVEYVPLPHGHSISEITPKKEFYNKTLKELELRNKYNIQVIAIKNNKKNTLKIVPHADDILKEDDTIIVCGKDENIDKIREEDNI